MSEKKHFPVDVEIDEDGIFIVSSPIFKVCHADGATIDEALGNLREVIGICMEEYLLKPELLLSGIIYCHRFSSLKVISPSPSVPVS